MSNTMKKSILPPIVVLGLLFLSSMVIDHSWRIHDPEMSVQLADISLIARFILLFFSTYLIYPIAFLGGLSPKTRMALSFTPHAYWVFYQSAIHMPLYSVPETIYLVFNPVFIFFIARTFFQVGLCEIVCRGLFRGRAASKPIDPAPALKCLAGGTVVMVLVVVFATNFNRFYFLLREMIFS